MPPVVGRTFCNQRGREELGALRMRNIPDVTGATGPIEMLARVPSEECGCPEEIWNFEGLILIFHFEEDGNSEACIFAGDWETEKAFSSPTLDHLRADAFGWIAEVLNTPEPDCRDIP